MNLAAEPSRVCDVIGNNQAIAIFYNMRNAVINDAHILVNDDSCHYHQYLAIDSEGFKYTITVNCGLPRPTLTIANNDNEQTQRYITTDEQDAINALLMQHTRIARC